MPKYAVNVTVSVMLDFIPAVSEMHAKQLAHTELERIINEKAEYQVTETDIYSVTSEPYCED